MNMIVTSSVKIITSTVLCCILIQVSHDDFMFRLTCVLGLLMTNTTTIRIQAHVTIDCQIIFTMLLLLQVTNYEVCNILCLSK